MTACRIAGILVLASCSILTGCDLLSWKLQGAPDPCRGEPRLGWRDIAACQQDRATELSSTRKLQDPTAGGCLEGTPLPFDGRPLRHVVALDYSGSMFGGYELQSRGEEPPCGPERPPYFWQQTEFSRLLREGMLAGLEPADPVHPMVFNAKLAVLGEADTWSAFESHQDRFLSPLPEPLVGADAVVRRLTAVEGGSLPPNPSDPPFSDPGQTRLPRVLEAAGAVFEGFDEREGVLWVVTDNIIEHAPDRAGEAPRDPEYNKRFYDRIKSDPRWQVVHAWPIHSDQAWLCGSTLMVYGFYYSSRERFDEEAYRQLVTGSHARIGNARQLETFRQYSVPESPFVGQPFKLKPQDIDAVKIAFQGDIRCRQVRVGEPSRCEAQLTLTNLLNHRRVESARLEMVNGRCDPVMTGRSQGLVRTATPLCAEAIVEEILLQEPLGPRETRTWPVTFHLPPVRTVRHTLRDYFENAQYHRFRMIGDMRVGIRELRTNLSLAPEALEGVYGVETLPAVFQYPLVESFDAAICLVLSVDNPTFFASLFLLVLVALILLGITLGSWLFVPTFRDVTFDGKRGPRLRLTRLCGVPLTYRSQRIGSVRKSRWGREPVLWGPRIQTRSNSWVYIEDPNLSSPVQIRFRSPRKKKRSPEPEDDWR